MLCSGVACWMDAGACCLLRITFCCVSSPQYLGLVWEAGWESLGGRAEQSLTGEVPFGEGEGFTPWQSDF